MSKTCLEILTYLAAITYWRAPNDAPPQAIVSRGGGDSVPACSFYGTIQVATLSAFVPLNFQGGTNFVDAAIAKTNGQVDPGGTILEIGAVSMATTRPAVEMQVMKAGEATGKTTGSIDNADVTVVYTGYGSSGTDKAKAAHQFSIVPFFVRSGDSGSLVVKIVPSGLPNPVGLVVGGLDDGTGLACPIRAVLSGEAFGGARVFANLGLTFVGNSPTVEELLNATLEPINPEIESASRVKDRYDDYLLTLPEVVGHGVGYSRTGSGKVVIQLYLRKATEIARRSAPTSLEGIPVETRETGEARVFQFRDMNGSVANGN